MTTERLPVEDVLDDVVAAVRDRGLLVLVAPPGAGKTTLVPLALADVVDGRIVVLEPRRVAARAAASRMAALVGERVGGTVGYSTRDDRKVSRGTRIEVVTEGILVRRLQRDPSLAGTDVVIFDEFHERNLVGDLSLAFSLETREALRPDLHLAVMSATIDAGPIAALLGGAPVVESRGRLHPIETSYRPRGDLADATEDVVAGTRAALDEGDGDVLVFLPGAREIRQVRDALGEPAGVEVAELHGSLPPHEQDAALAPASAGRRKVVLSTDVAESSITVPGVRAVVDLGLARRPAVDVGTGMTRLETVRVSQASADQRRGRAGRTAPGRCYRLWAERDRLEPQSPPEIHSVDLTGFALELAAWGAAAPAELRLLDQPREHAWAEATRLLLDLGALDAGGRLTEHGRELADLPVHPRIAHMLVRGRDAGLGWLAAGVGALLEDRDVLTGARRPADIGVRLAALDGGGGAGVRRAGVRRARRERERLARALGIEADTRLAIDRAGEVLVHAYPDRVAVQRGGRGRFVHSNGRGAWVGEQDVLAGEPLLVVADVDDRGDEARVQIAAAIDQQQLARAAPGAIVTEEVGSYDPERGDVVAERRTRVGAAILARSPLPADVAAEGLVEAITDAIRARGLELLPWDRDTTQLRARLGFLHRHIGDPWPAMDEDTLLDELGAWLGPFLGGVRRVADLRRVPLADALRSRVPYEVHRRIDELAPERLEVPSGSRIRLDYTAGEVPALPVKLQEMFGAVETPRIAGGRVPVVVHLLSPAQRPLQVTQDLAGFWSGTYADVRAEMRGRYPKHPWPEDPTTATPTKRTKRRS